MYTHVIYFRGLLKWVVSERLVFGSYHIWTHHTKNAPVDHQALNIHIYHYISYIYISHIDIHCNIHGKHP